MLTSSYRNADAPFVASFVPGEQLHWLSVVTHLDPRFGGLSAVVPQLSHEIARREHIRMDVAAFCAPGELYSTSSYPEVSISEWPTSRAKWFSDRSLKASFAELIRPLSGLHIHGIWEQSTHIAARLARAHGVPYVVSAHGMLERWALEHKAFKKKVYAALVERPTLAQAACLHALTLAEAGDYRRFGCTAPIAVVPNGVRIPAQVTPDLFLRQHRELEGKRIVLFLGRIHAKKGLDLLVRAWKEIVREHASAALVLAGPDFEGSRARLTALIEAEGLAEQVLFTGMLRGELKWSALAAAECFVLPSFSEGLSVSVLEAMGVGLPVIVSTHCNLPEVATLGAGWVIAAEQRPLAAALAAMLAHTREENRRMGEEGARFVLENYNWASVAEKMAAIYRWVSEGGAAPATVLTADALPGGRTR